MNISNNTILITGGATGIGLALAKRFAALSNTVIIVGRNEAALASAVAETPMLIAHRCDLAKRVEREELVMMVEQQFPMLNVLINNAGVQYNYDLANTSNLPRIEPEITTNLTAPIELCSLLMPLLAEQNKSAIVNVSSGLAFVPKRSAPVYCATKAGLHSFTKALRYQLEGTNITVMELIPPLVDTQMTQGRGTGKISPLQLADEFLRAFEKDEAEINIGRTAILRVLNRFLPSVAERIMKQS